jgi:hypothetical protein
MPTVDSLEMKKRQGYYLSRVRTDRDSVYLDRSHSTLCDVIRNGVRVDCHPGKVRQYWEWGKLLDIKNIEK